jgi:hypothetical protein
VEAALKAGAEALKHALEAGIGSEHTLDGEQRLVAGVATPSTRRQQSRGNADDDHDEEAAHGGDGRRRYTLDRRQHEWRLKHDGRARGENSSGQPEAQRRAEHRDHVRVPNGRALRRVDAGEGDGEAEESNDDADDPRRRRAAIVARHPVVSNRYAVKKRRLLTIPGSTLPDRHKSQQLKTPSSPR